MLKKILPTVLLVVALLVAALLASQSPRSRFSSLEVPAGALPEVYLQMKTGTHDKCLVGGRGRTTSKRSEEDLGKASWRCRLEGEAPVTFVAQSKLEPSFLFVPVTRVDDIAFPWVYERLRDQLAWPAPAMRWVHLFHNRQFRGLYLEVQLAARALAAEHQLGRLELLAVRDHRLTCFDRKMRPVCPIYNLAVADGVFPTPRPTAAARQLFELTAQAADGQPERAFVISDTDYSVLLPLPLPFAVHDVLPSAQASYADDRYGRWFETPQATQADASLTPNPSTPATPSTTDFKAQLAALPASLTATCQVMPCDAERLLHDLRQSPSLQWLGDAAAGGEGN